MGATTLTKLINKGNIEISSEQRVEIKNYVLEYLATRSKLQGYVMQALVLLYARITKIGWNDVRKETHVLRTVTDDISKFLSVSTEC